MKKKRCYNDDMFIGNFDPLRLIFGVMDTLLRKGLVSYEEARAIIQASLPPTMEAERKTEILDSMITRVSQDTPASPSGNPVSGGTQTNG